MRTGGTAPPLHRSTAPPLHRSTAPPLQLAMFCAGVIAGWALMGVGDGVIQAFVTIPQTDVEAAKMDADAIKRADVEAQTILAPEVCRLRSEIAALSSLLCCSQEHAIQTTVPSWAA